MYINVNINACKYIYIYTYIHVYIISESPDVYAPCPYVRSEHLDSVVWLMHEASVTHENETFKIRETKARGILIGVTYS
jgi:hypothetical protein